jgi:hypothetical protein
MTTYPGVIIPTNRSFLKNVRKYKTVEKVKIDGKTTIGIKNLHIIQVD